MFSSKFDCLAEIEALRAGFKPSAVSSVCNVRLVPRGQRTPDVEPPPPIADDAGVRQEMERRLAARLAIYDPPGTREH